MNGLPPDKSPRRMAAWSDGVCKTCGSATHFCKCDHPPSPLLDMLKAQPRRCRFYADQKCTCNGIAFNPSDCT